MFDTSVVLSFYSESSMFVSKRRFILKTCGTTLLLQALVPLLELAREYCGFDAIEVRHTHTNNMRTCKQLYPSAFYVMCVAVVLNASLFAEFLLLPQELHEASPPRVPSSKLPGGSGLSQPDFPKYGTFCDSGTTVLLCCSVFPPDKCILLLFFALLSLCCFTKTVILKKLKYWYCVNNTYDGVV